MLGPAGPALAQKAISHNGEWGRYLCSFWLVITTCVNKGSKTKSVAGLKLLYLPVSISKHPTAPASPSAPPPDPISFLPCFPDTAPSPALLRPSLVLVVPAHGYWDLPEGCEGILREGLRGSSSDGGESAQRHGDVLAVLHAWTACETVEGKKKIIGLFDLIIGLFHLQPLSSPQPGHSCQRCDGNMLNNTRSEGTHFFFNGNWQFCPKLCMLKTWGLDFGFITWKYPTKASMVQRFPELF